MRRRLTHVLAALAVMVTGLAPSTAAAAAPQCTAVPGQFGDSYFDCANGQVLNVLPPGSNGLTSATDLPNGSSPHEADQLGMYANLKKVAPNLTAGQILDYYKPESFGVAPGDVDRVDTFPAPHDGTVIVWDKSKGVPHVFGRSRADTEFGAGYAAAHDRLFMMDVLRHIGRSRLAEFIGPSAQAFQEDCTIAHVAGYSEKELEYQANALAGRYTTPFGNGNDEGAQVFADGSAYVNGINAYIDAARVDPANKMPVEYFALPATQAYPAGLGPQHWGPADIVAVATIVQSIFAVGGGNEIQSALLLASLTGRYGQTKGLAIWKDLRSQNDPEAPTTLQQPFPYMNGANSNDFSLPGIGIPDGQPKDNVCQRVLPPSSAARAAPRSAITPNVHLDLPTLVPGRTKLSNALLVAGSHTASGHPIAVFGPQVSYFVPEILHEEDLHGPGINARGSSFPGTDVYVELGRGTDYAWSATSASSDLIDQHLEPICDPSSPTVFKAGAADGKDYWYQGHCVPMYERRDEEIAGPSAASQSAVPGAMVFNIERTLHGPVIGRTTMTYAGQKGVPAAVSYQRSTWFDELGAAAAFLNWNDPDKIHGAADFMRAASKETGTFNWFYIDSHDIAYYSSGRLPIRSNGMNPNLPGLGTGEYDWNGFSPVACSVTTDAFDSTGPPPFNSSTGGQTTDCGYDANWLRADGSFGDPHPHAVNPPQGFLTNWNNKPAPGWSAADSNFNYGPVYRVQSLTDRVKAAIARGPVQPTDIVNAMEDAGSVDLDGAQVVPYIDQELGTTPLTPSEQQVLGILNDWATETYAGSTIPAAHRRTPLGLGTQANSYVRGNAVAIMDVLYGKLVHGVFNNPVDPWLDNNQFTLTGDLLFSPQPGQAPGITNAPGPTGSAYDGGWEGMLQRSLRQAHDAAIANPYSQSYCAGSPTGTPTSDRCQQIIKTALDETIAQLTSAYGSSNPASWDCKRSNDASKGQCNPNNDDVVFQALGLQKVPNIEWINRPTFQQVVQFPTSRADQPHGGVEAQSVPGLPATGAPPGQTQPVLPLLAAVLLAGGLSLLARRAFASPKRR